MTGDAFSLINSTSSWRSSCINLWASFPVLFKMNLIDLLCNSLLELSRAPFKAGKLSNGGVGLYVHYNNEDILVSAEVSFTFLATVNLRRLQYHFMKCLHRKCWTNREKYSRNFCTERVIWYHAPLFCWWFHLRKGLCFDLFRGFWPFLSSAEDWLKICSDLFKRSLSLFVSHSTYLSFCIPVSHFHSVQL